MKAIFAIIFLTSGLLGFAQNDYCTHYTTDQFFNLPEALEPIDLNNPNIALIEAAVFHAANGQRAKHGKPILSYNYELSVAALGHSQEMKEKNFFNHINSRNASNKTFMDRIALSGATFNTTGENLSKMDMMATTKKDFRYFTQLNNGKYEYYVDASSNKQLGVNTYASYGRKVIHYLMRSKGHRANLLETKFTHQGIGITIIHNSRLTKELPKAYMTQNFGG